VVQLIQFRSFEETLALLAALIAGVVAYKLFRIGALTAVLIGGLSAVAVAYATFFEFTLQDNVITYRNRFRQISFPLSHVQKVGMDTLWAGLPGHMFMFIMRSPPAPMAGYFLRTGLVSWPSASNWVEAVNSAIQSKTSSSK
jgi:hypothetical protein